MASVTITKDMTIGELLDINQGLAPVLMAGGYALHRLSVFSDGDAGRGCCCA